MAAHAKVSRDQQIFLSAGKQKLSQNRVPMTTRPCLLFPVLILVGCNGSPPPGASPKQARRAPPTSVDECIATWGEMGMWLPDAEQVELFRRNFDSARGSLHAALSNPDHSVRMRAAYVIGEIGASAKPAGQDLLARLKDEDDELVRIYIVQALSAIDYDTNAALSTLGDRYAALDGENVPLKLDHSYAEVDEKITVASALYVLMKTDTNARREYLDFVTKWLAPPADDLSGNLLEGYWERRLVAVLALERMPDAVDAIPKLELLQAEPNRKPWVDAHVPRVLAVLRKNVR